MNSTRPPRWHRDEIILALALYRTLDPKDMNINNILVLELSELLNRLPLHERKAIYTTNAIESLNSVIRTAVNKRKVFPSDQAAWVTSALPVADIPNNKLINTAP